MSEKIRDDAFVVKKNEQFDGTEILVVFKVAFDGMVTTREKQMSCKTVQEEEQLIEKRVEEIKKFLWKEVKRIVNEVK